MNRRTWVDRVFDGILWTFAGTFAIAMAGAVSLAISDYTREEEARKAKVLENVHRAGMAVGAAMCVKELP